MVKKSGGEILGNPMNIPGIGEFVMFKDTEGNMLACCNRQRKCDDKKW